MFPEQLACVDNRTGPIVAPDHPLVKETINNCLYEAMDTAGLSRLVADFNEHRVDVRAVETPAPSPMAHEILNANPYAFLDDAPLEERRARAVSLRRFDPDLAKGLAGLADSGRPASCIRSLISGFVSPTSERGARAPTS